MADIRLDRMQDLRDATLKFIRENKVHCHTPDQAMGRCYDVSEEFTGWLKTNGVKATIIRGRKFKGRLGPDAAWRWRTRVSEDLVHHAVLIEESGPAYHTVVDLTGSQFGVAQSETFYSLNTWLNNWEIVAVGDPAVSYYSPEQWTYLQGSEAEDVESYEFRRWQKSGRHRRPEVRVRGHRRRV